MTRRPLDPRICSVAIDANALNRDGSAHDELVHRLLRLSAPGTIRLLVPNFVTGNKRHFLEGSYGVTGDHRLLEERRHP